MKLIHIFVFAFVLLLVGGCEKIEKGTSETSSAPESLYKGQTHALEKAKDLENITETAFKKKTTPLADASQ